MKKISTLIVLVISATFAAPAFAGMPVIDGANLANNQISHIATIAKWVESIAQLKEQVNIQGQLRNWTGNPADVAKILSLGILDESDLLREYGLSHDGIARAVQSLDTLSRTDGGTYPNWWKLVLFQYILNNPKPAIRCGSSSTTCVPKNSSSRTSTSAVSVSITTSPATCVPADRGGFTASNP